MEFRNVKDFARTQIDTSLSVYSESMYGFFRRTILQSTLGQIGASFTIVALTWEIAPTSRLLLYICIHYFLLTISTYCSCATWTVNRRGADGVPKYAGLTGVLARIWCGSLCWLALPACADFSFVAINCIVLAACAAGGIISLGPMKSLARQTLMALLLPFSLACFWTGYGVLGAAVLFFLVVVAFRGVNQLHDAYCELIMLRAESNSIAQEMETKNRQLVRTNQSLEHEIAQREESERQRISLQDELIAASRRAGMSEVATGVLHNIGNVMNSVNVAASLVQDRLKDRISNKLRAAYAMLRGQESLVHFYTNDPRAEHLPDFLELMYENSIDITEQLCELRQKVDYVNQAVAEQQAFASHVDVAEPIQIATLFSEALSMQKELLDRVGIHVSQQGKSALILRVDRYRILRVLQSLISNSIQSIRLAQQTDPVLVLQIAEEAEEVLLSVTDNGGGIAAQDLKGIFGHGCRTIDNEGHMCYSLHQCACSLEEIGAKLVADSKGLGQGATFTIRLPKTCVAADDTESSAMAAATNGNLLTV